MLSWYPFQLYWRRWGQGSRLPRWWIWRRRWMIILMDKTTKWFEMSSFSGIVYAKLISPPIVLMMLRTWFMIPWWRWKWWWWWWWFLWIKPRCNAGLKWVYSLVLSRLNWYPHQLCWKRQGHRYWFLRWCRWWWLWWFWWWRWFTTKSSPKWFEISLFSGIV